MRRIVLAAVIASVLMGCDQDTVDRPEIMVEEIGQSVEVERKLSATTCLDWTGTTATDFLARTQAMEIGADGDVSTGGSKWSVITDSFGSWGVKFGAIAVGGLGILALIGSFASVLGSTGGIGKLVSGAIQTLTFPFPVFGSIVQSAKARFKAKQFSQVVAGGDKFKSALFADPILASADKDRIWDLYKGSQQQAQDGTTQQAVQLARGQA